MGKTAKQVQSPRCKGYGQFQSGDVLRAREEEEERQGFRERTGAEFEDLCTRLNTDLLLPAMEN